MPLMIPAKAVCFRIKDALGGFQCLRLLSGPQRERNTAVIYTADYKMTFGKHNMPWRQ